MNKKKKMGIVITIIAILILLKILTPITNLYVDWLWFKSLHYEKVFTTMLFSKIALGVISGLVFFIILYTNLWLVRKLCPSNYVHLNNFNIPTNILRQFFGLIIFIATIIISTLVGIGASYHWESFQFFTHASSFGETDPIFHKDISFYIFSYPFLKYIYEWLFHVLIWSFILTVLMYIVQSGIKFSVFEENYTKIFKKYFVSPFYILPKAKNHLLILFSLMFFLKCYGHTLHKYELIFQKNTLFTGISYTDHKILIPCLTIMIIIEIICGILVLYNIKNKTLTPIASGIITIFLAYFIILGVIPTLFEQYIVTPNQLEKEKPYLQYAIDNTNKAWGLDGINIKDFEANNTLTQADLENNKPTIENIRLWDAAQLKHSYSQVQTIQQYYTFKDIDVDRYWINENGENKYRQVWLSARELGLNPSLTWVNTRLQYTHGYGYVMSPVNETSTEGMPKFFVYDIPPKTNINFPIDKMGIYVGETESNEIFVNTKTKEFDYPKGSETVTNSYDGNDGIMIKNFFRRLIFAYHFRDINIIFNTDINNSSQILYNRNISERIQTLLPFMEFDKDPYLITSNGKLYWMIDGFTSSNLYPYSDSGDNSYNINYLRNSFKIVIDAYSGEVDVYYTDKPKKDPIMHAYNKIYPGVFKDISTMPKDLLNHIRYSETMFKKQIVVYENYHQTDPQVFYNKSDMWDVPKTGSLTGETQDDEYINMSNYLDTNWENTQNPFYNIMKLPGNTEEEFILMNTFTRKGKQNMCSWICVGCDGDNYGKITLFNFPKDKNVYGPEQIISKAKQDDIISPQLTLWSQEGSGISTGKLITIPIEKSLLYVLPLYLESNNTKIPELKRVIVALGDKILMEKDLNTALSKLVTGEISTQKIEKKNTSVKATQTQNNNKAQIQDAYKKAKSAAEQGDWATYGKEIDNLGTLINQL